MPFITIEWKRGEQIAPGSQACPECKSRGICRVIQIINEWEDKDPWYPSLAIAVKECDLWVPKRCDPSSEYCPV